MGEPGRLAVPRLVVGRLRGGRVHSVEGRREPCVLQAIPGMELPRPSLPGP